MKRLRRDQTRDGWTLKSTSRLCSDHFLEKYIRRNPNHQRVQLTEDAVPTRFKTFPKGIDGRAPPRVEPAAQFDLTRVNLPGPDLPGQIQKKTKRRSPRKRPKLYESSDSDVTDYESTDPAPIIDDDNENEEEGPSNGNSDIFRYVKHLEEQLESSNKKLVIVKKKLKASQQRTRRLEKRLKKRTEVITGNSMVALSSIIIRYLWLRHS